MLKETNRSNSAMNQSRAQFTETVPVFINVRDRLSCLLELIDWFERAGHQNITLIDNASTYPPLVQFLNSTKHHTIRLKQNVGHTALWRVPTLRGVISKHWYVYTDPDVIPTEECPLDAVAYLHDLLQQFPYYLKAGLGLKIDDLPDHYHLKQDVIEWESALFGREIAPDVLQANVDTTFALHRPGTPYIMGPAMRTKGMYETRHLPWYVKSGHIDPEELYYRDHASPTVSNWNTSGGMRLSALHVAGGMAARMESDPASLLDEIRRSRIGRTALLINRTRSLLSLTKRRISFNVEDQRLCRKATLDLLTSEDWRLARRITDPLTGFRSRLKAIIPNVKDLM